MNRILEILVNRTSQRQSDETDTVAPPELSQLDAFGMGNRVLRRSQFDLGRYVVEHEVPGDFVECGVYNGGSAGALALALGGSQKHLWLYDSFEGLPPTLEVDGSEAPELVGHLVGSETLVRESMRVAGLTPERFTIRKGWFKDTFRERLPNKVSLLHIDADWYESVLLSLQTFYHLVSPGGLILLDDFGHWEGCREAFYDFVRACNIKPLLERVGHSQAYWIKDRSHNRDMLVVDENDGQTR